MIMAVRPETRKATLQLTRLVRNPDRDQAQRYPAIRVKEMKNMAWSRTESLSCVEKMRTIGVQIIA